MSVITTERLVLRPPRTSDVADLFALFNDWAVIEWLSAPPWPYARADMEGFIAHRLAVMPPASGAFHVITSAGAPIGGISWLQREAGRGQSGDGPHIAYWLGAPYWGHGYMTEVVDGVARHIFATPGLDAIYSGAFTGNAASLRVQTKLGFVHDGEILMRSKPQNADLPLIKTVLTRPAFAAAHPRKRS